MHLWGISPMRSVDVNFEILTNINWTPQKRHSNELKKGIWAYSYSFKQYYFRMKTLITTYIREAFGSRALNLPLGNLKSWQCGTLFLSLWLKQMVYEDNLSLTYLIGMDIIQMKIKEIRKGENSILGTTIHVQH